MASKKLRPGSFKSSKGPVRRTGRTTGISQSAFAGYGFQPNQQAAPPPAEPADKSPDSETSDAEDDQAAKAHGEKTKDEAEEAGDSAE